MNAIIWEISDSVTGLIIGDKGYLSTSLQQELLTPDILLKTPLRSNLTDIRPPAFVKLLIRTRRLIETVIGQLVGRFSIEKVWARDLWHLTSRLNRKL
jgi:Transposase DDE domain